VIRLAPMRRLRTHGPIVLLLVVFGAVYATALGAYGMFMWDEAEYASLARSVLMGEGFSISGAPNRLRPPVLPLAGAASMLVSGSRADVVLRAPSIVFSLLALFTVYWGVQAQRDRTTGLAAAAALGMFPAFWVATPHALTEIPFMAFLCAAILLFYFGLYRSARCFWWSWLCFGLALLTRYNAVLFFPVSIVFLAIALVSGAPDVRRRVRSRSFRLSPLLGLAILAPWFIREQLTFGDALIGMKQASAQLQVYQMGISMPWHFYVARVPEMIGSMLTPFLVLGIVWTVWTRDRLGLHCLAVAVGIVASVSSYRYKEIRLVTFVLPFVAILVSLGLTQPLFLARRTWRSHALLAVLLGGALVANWFATRYVFRQVVTLGYPSFLPAMQFLREHTARGAVLVGANYPQIFWYADRRAIDLPEESALPAVLEHADWVIVTNFERGQKSYALRLIDKVTAADVQAGNLRSFRDAQFFTILIRASWLRAQR